MARTVWPSAAPSVQSCWRGTQVSPRGGCQPGETAARAGQGWLPAERVFGPGPVPRYDAGKDGFIDLMELKRMMEKLGAPQTHLGLKTMIKEVDEDVDSKLSFREVRVLPTHHPPLEP